MPVPLWPPVCRGDTAAFARAVNYISLFSVGFHCVVWLGLYNYLKRDLPPPPQPQGEGGAPLDQAHKSRATRDVLGARPVPLASERRSDP